MTEPRALVDPWEGVAATIMHADLYPPAPGWVIPRSTMPYDCLFYVWKGRGWIEVDDERFEAAAGDLFSLRRGRTLAAGHDERTPIMPLSVGFHLRRNERVDAIRDVLLPHRTRLRPEDLPGLHTLLMEVITLHHQPAPWARLAAAGAMLRVFAEALRLIASASADRKTAAPAPLAGDETMAARVQAWIDQHLADRITLTGLARVAKLTPTHFAAAFRKQTGASPMHYLRCRRVEVSRSMLAAGDRSVEEVARAVGYSDPFHFSRVFRSQVRVAPREYRDSLKHPFQP